MIQKKIKEDKAVTFDGSNHNFFKKIDPKHLQILWNKNFLNKINEKFFECRLIPLNKNFPMIPDYKQFRPISIISPLIKVIELRLLQKLQIYMKEELDPFQIGFIENL